jgi:hypothetical protein
MQQTLAGVQTPATIWALAAATPRDIGCTPGSPDFGMPVAFRQIVSDNINTASIPAAQLFYRLGGKHG